MRFINPNVEWWQQETTSQHIARVGRICYKSEGKQPPFYLDEDGKADFIRQRDENRTKSFWQSGHRSMYRHGTAYFYIPNDNAIPRNMWAFLVTSPYIDYVAKNHQVWISTNMQFLCENGNLYQTFNPFLVSEDEFIRRAKNYPKALWLLRMTFVVTTQISTSREMNRTSPNAIAEQSTRYCNLRKKGGVQICRPQWLHDGKLIPCALYRLGCRMGAIFYRLLLLSGAKPQDARGVLPLDTYTTVAYTYSIAEWKNIIDLRYHETTGKAHPNAKFVAGMIRNTIYNRMSKLIPDFDI
jgi:hypothetical protein